MGLIARGLAIDSNAPKYVKVDPPKNQGSRGFRVYLGTIPDYSQGDIKGVKLSGVADKGPAGVAGVKGGDVITGLGDEKILNIYDYTEAMAELKVGVETTITVKRELNEPSDVQPTATQVSVTDIPCRSRALARSMRRVMR